MKNTTFWQKWVIGDLSWKRFLRSALILYVIVFAWAWLSTDRLAFLPPPPGYADSPDIAYLTHPNGDRVAYLHLPHPDARAVILFAHGNAEDLGYLRDFLDDYNRRGYEIYAFDYRGYGQSTGKPGVRRAREDMQLLYDHILESGRWEAQQVIPHGRSLGSNFALHLASRNPVGGVILESPFLNGFRALTRIQLYPVDPLPNDKLIRRIDAPLLILHGQLDSILPLFHAHGLHKRAADPKHLFISPLAGHNDLYDTDPEAYFRAVGGMMNDE